MKKSPIKQSINMERQNSQFRLMVLSTLAQLVVCLVVWKFNIPNPNIILFVVLSAVLVKCGYLAGSVCGIVAFVYSAFFFSTDHDFFLYIFELSEAHCDWIGNYR